MSSTAPNGCVIAWFRNDLRLHDNPSLLKAVHAARSQGLRLLPVFVHRPDWTAANRWGFVRHSAHVSAWWRMALDDLSAQLRERGSHLVECVGDAATVLSALCQETGAVGVWCERIDAPEEQDDVAALKAHGVPVHETWQSSLIDPADLPFSPHRVPDVFTAFRSAVETEGVREAQTVAAPDALPPPPAVPMTVHPPVASPRATPDARAAFPWHDPDWHGGERAALRHLQRYCERRLPVSYKATRNALSDVDASSKWSPWLATGALSARQAMASIRAFEAEHGASDGSYWLWFELLWRDHFRLLHTKHGRALYRARGLATSAMPSRPTRPDALSAWCEGRTGHPLIDAGMRELAATGYLSNRLRQIVASYLIHDLGVDWRAGAAWFESRLIDHDVYSNQGNWLYISGRGTDPRGGRRFNPDKQARDHDPEGTYQHRWRAP